MKALIFDMGGVLVDLDLEACKSAFRKIGFNEVDEVLDLCHQKGIFGKMEEGVVTADEFRSYIIAGSAPRVTPEDVNQALGKILVGIAPYKIDMLRRLSTEYDLYILSNNNPIAMSFATGIFRNAGFTLEEGFKKCFLSHEMKVLKPADSFYKKVIADIGLPAEEMLFIDDSQKNVEASIAAGLPAIWYEPGTDLAALLNDYLK